MTNDDIKKIKNVSDMQCSAHANLRDRYHRRSTILDLTIFALSTWLVGLVFVEPHINFSLTPFGLPPNIWLGVLAIFTFFLSIVQMKVNWKGKADAHAQSLNLHSNVKRECVFLLAEPSLDPNDVQIQKMLVRHEIASNLTSPIPENEFLKQKKKHLIKQEISRYLSENPSALIWLARLKIWWRDNVRR
ncbi:MAG: hypothetical protein RIA64_16530 [Rhodospirillales bacterium]